MIRFFLLLCFPLIAGAQSQFQKIQLNPDFYSEGINIGDFNRDSVLDIVSGPYWYPGPNFSEKKEYTAPRSTPWDTTGDSDSYLHFVYDLNGDGWEDILRQSVPGEQLYWYENPQNATGYWTQHLAYAAVGNESPWFTDVDGDKLPEVVFMTGGALGWASPNWNDVQQPWAFRAISGNEGYGRFAHGLGVGDINKDGLLDIIEAEGWWEGQENPGLWTRHSEQFWDRRYANEGIGGGQIHVYDVDGDGDNDVITSLQAHGWDLAWFENLDSVGGSFQKHMIMGNRAEENVYGVAFSQMHTMDIGDLDGDGLADIVTGKRKGAHGNEQNYPALLYWFKLHRGDSVYFEPQFIDSTAGVGTQVLARDVNGDGKLDILTARRNGAYVFLNEMDITPIVKRPDPLMKKVRVEPMVENTELRNIKGARFEDYENVTPVFEP